MMWHKYKNEISCIHDFKTKLFVYISISHVLVFILINKLTIFGSMLRNFGAIFRHMYNN